MVAIGNDAANLSNSAWSELSEVSNSQVRSFIFFSAAKRRLTKALDALQLHRELYRSLTYPPLTLLVGLNSAWIHNACQTFFKQIAFIIRMFIGYCSLPAYDLDSQWLGGVQTYILHIIVG